MNRRKFGLVSLASFASLGLPASWIGATETASVVLSPGRIYCSPETLEDIRNWACNTIDEETAESFC